MRKRYRIWQNVFVRFLMRGSEEYFRDIRKQSKLENKSSQDAYVCFENTSNKNPVKLIILFDTAHRNIVN